MKKDIYLPIFGIIYGEFMTLYGEIFYGLAIRLITLLAIIIKIVYKPSLELETKIILQSIILLILLQSINMSMPRLFNTNLQNYLLIYGTMILPIYSTIKNIDINFRKKHIYYIFTAILIGTITIIFEYGMMTTDILSINGEILVVFLIILLSISLLVLDTKYWNKKTSNIFDVCSNSLIPIFMAIVILRIITIVK